MSVYFYCGHIERIGSDKKFGNFCGVITASDATAAYERAEQEQTQEVSSVTGLSRANFCAIFHKFEKVE